MRYQTELSGEDNFECGWNIYHTGGLEVKPDAHAKTITEVSLKRSRERSRESEAP